MREFECKKAAVCENLCCALRAQGLDTRNNDGTCTMPDVLTASTNGRDVRVVGVPQNIEITQHILSELRDELATNTESNPEIAQLIEAHGDIMSAHTARWQAMVDAAQSGRQFMAVENNYYQTAINEAHQQYAEIGSTLTSDEVVTAQAAFDSRTLKSMGIVFEEQSIAMLDILAGNYLDHKPTLLVGDKGIAKTKLARFMGSLASDGQEPIFISGKGDQMSDEFMGRYVQDTETGTFVFREGKAVEAMRLGKPLVIDEINLADQGITMRLQDILLRKPGESITLTENGGQEVVIAPGFTVFATANEASERYKHRVALDPAFRDRFEVVRFNYPDSDNDRPLQQIPTSLMRLAIAAICDENGIPSQHINLTELEEFVRVAHVTQKLYSTPLAETGMQGDLSETTADFLDGDKPPMTDCITPRTMIDTLVRCADGNKPGVTLAGKIETLIANLDQAGASQNANWARKAQQLLRGEVIKKSKKKGKK